MSDFNIGKEEYLTLRKEIESQMTELAQLERGCVLAAAIVYAWLGKDGSTYPSGCLPSVIDSCIFKEVWAENDHS